MPSVNILAFFNMPGGAEWVLILVVALLIFGRRLPDVARSLGKSIVEFKRGIRDVNTDIEEQSRQNSDRSSQPKRLDSDPARDRQSSAPAASETNRDENG